MHIEARMPPRPKSYQRKNGYRSYAELMNRLAAQPGVWLQVDPKDLAGGTERAKQNSINQAARRRSLLIQTTAQDGGIYVRSEPKALGVGM